MQKIIDRREWLDRLEIGALDGSDIGDVLDVLARGLRDNPLHVVAFGEDPERRRQGLRTLISAAFAFKDVSHTLVARREDGVIVGVCCMLPPCDSLPDLGQRLWLLPALVPTGPGAAGRHWHLGPVAVDAHLQGMGVGSRLMQVFCARMDAAGEDAYLETDKPMNVRFFEGFGFDVVDEQEVLGFPNWIMLRKVEGRRG